MISDNLLLIRKTKKEKCKFHSKADISVLMNERNTNNLKPRGVIKIFNKIFKIIHLIHQLLYDILPKK